MGMGPLDGPLALQGPWAQARSGVAYRLSLLVGSRIGRQSSEGTVAKLSCALIIKSLKCSLTPTLLTLALLDSDSELASERCC
jgi:hypothetical protein